MTPLPDDLTFADVIAIWAFTPPARESAAPPDAEPTEGGWRFWRAVLVGGIACIALFWLPVAGIVWLVHR